MKSVDAAQEASDSLHKNYIGDRYIEVFQVGVATVMWVWLHGCGYSDVGKVWCRWAWLQMGVVLVICGGWR